MAGRLRPDHRARGFCPPGAKLQVGRPRPHAFQSCAGRLKPAAAAASLFSSRPLHSAATSPSRCRFRTSFPAPAKRRCFATPCITPIGRWAAFCAKQASSRGGIIRCVVLVADHGHPLPGNSANESPAKFHIPLVLAGGALRPEARGRVVSPFWLPNRRSRYPASPAQPAHHRLPLGPRLAAAGAANLSLFTTSTMVSACSRRPAPSPTTTLRGA